MGPAIRSLFTVLFSVSLSVSAISCEAAVKGSLDFGSPPLGSSRHRLPKAAVRGADCVVEPRFADCEFQGRDGVFYLVYGDVITRKEVRYDSTHPSTAPFGLDRDDDIEQVVRKLSSRGVKFTRVTRRNTTSLVSERLRNTLGTSYEFYVDFGSQGHWRVIGVSSGE